MPPPLISHRPSSDTSIRAPLPFSASNSQLPLKKAPRVWKVTLEEPLPEQAATAAAATPASAYRSAARGPTIRTKSRASPAGSPA